MSQETDRLVAEAMGFDLSSGKDIPRFTTEWGAFGIAYDYCLSRGVTPEITWRIYGGIKECRVELFSGFRILSFGVAGNPKFAMGEAIIELDKRRKSRRRGAK